jgi:DNA invertase Pin-like site-specific DNA recombinase
LDDLKRGVTPNGERVDGLIVYDIDRLTRDNRHLEDAIEVVQNFGARSSTSRVLSTSSPTTAVRSRAS